MCSGGQCGRIVLFGCHPEHLTWNWNDGQVFEDNLGTLDANYIYCYPPQQINEEPDPQQMLPPPNNTDSIIQNCAKWIVEVIL